MRDKDDGTRPTVIVTAGIVHKDGRLLIAQRRKGSDLAYKWEFPGGKIEPGESPEECIKRELREELGIETEVEDIYHAFFYDYPEFRVLLLCYRCIILSGEPCPLECESVKWVDYDGLRREMQEGRMVGADVRLVQRLLSRGLPPLRSV